MSKLGFTPIDPAEIPRRDQEAGSAIRFLQEFLDTDAPAAVIALNGRTAKNTQALLIVTAKAKSLAVKAVIRKGAVYLIRTDLPEVTE